MAISNFEFSRRWTDSSPETGFKTFEPDEATVRADMQLLFDELASYINTNIIPRLNSDESSFSSIGDAITNILQQLVDMTQGSVADKAITANKIADGGAVGTPVDVTNMVNLQSSSESIQIADNHFLYFRTLGAVYFEVSLHVSDGRKNTEYYLTQSDYIPRSHAAGIPGVAAQACVPSKFVSIMTTPFGQGRCHRVFIQDYNFADTAYVGDVVVTGWYGCDGATSTEEDS